MDDKERKGYESIISTYGVIIEDFIRVAKEQEDHIAQLKLEKEQASQRINNCVKGINTAREDIEIIRQDLITTIQNVLAHKGMIYNNLNVSKEELRSVILSFLELERVLLEKVC